MRNIAPVRIMADAIHDKCRQSWSRVPAVANVAEIIKTAMRNHPADCEFEGGRERAVTLITRRVMSRLVWIRDWVRESDVVEIIAQEFEAVEIYCPHEGIDRRLEDVWPI